MSRDEEVNLFNEANDQFQRGNQLSRQDREAAENAYQEALMRFKRLVDEGGIRNGKLYYNIGNVYFRMGDLGRAILNYRKAQLYIPNDVNLIQNLQYARSRRAENFARESGPGVLRNVLLFWHYDLATWLRALLFSIFFVVFWLLLIIRLFKQKLAPRTAVVICAVLMLMFGGSLIYESIATQAVQEGVVVDREVLARKGDGETYQPTFKDPLHAGVEFELVEKRNGWLHIALPNGARTWIPSQAAEMIR